MFNKESSKKPQKPDQQKDHKPETHPPKEDSNNPFSMQLFQLSPLSPILQTVKKSFQFSSPHCDLAMINTPLGINKQKSLIEEVDEESHQKISMVLGFEEANEADEVDEDSSQFQSERYSSSEVVEEAIQMIEKVEIEQKNQEEAEEEDQKIIPKQEDEKIKVTQKIQKRKSKPANITRKVACNCKKTKCLKLYCDCFREGQYCDENCNCSGCHNTDQYQSERNTSILSLLQRNPEAFKPKVEAEQHSKGCNCKKSGCLKKYCECYQAGLVCGEHCKCEDCKNCGERYRNKSQMEEQVACRLK